MQSTCRARNAENLHEFERRLGPRMTTQSCTPYAQAVYVCQALPRARERTSGAECERFRDDLDAERKASHRLPVDV